MSETGDGDAMEFGSNDEAEVQHEFELADHQARLEDLEDRLNVVYPTPDTPVGGGQRLRIDIPAPRTIFTAGARGMGATDGPAIGPGGFGLHTVEHFGAEIQGNTCVDTDGLTIVHSGEATRLITQADLGIAASSSMHVGTDGGDVEITAGQVAANDPEFTVHPSMAVPHPPQVDTSGPRGGAEGTSSGLGRVWTALSAATAVRSWNSFLSSFALSSGVSAGTLSARASTVLGLVRASVSAYKGLAAAAAGAAAAFDVSEPPDSGDPKVKLHGAGGVAITTPKKVSAFGESVSLSASYTASLKSTWSTSVKSASYTSMYGGLAVSVSSEGPAGIKSYHNAATLSGKFADVAAKQTAVFRSDGVAQISAGEKLSVESPEIAIGGSDVWVSATDDVEAQAKFVKTNAEEQNNVFSQNKVQVLAANEIGLHIGQAGNDGIDIESGKIKLDPGGSMPLEVEPNSIRASSKFTLTNSTFRVTGVRIHLG
ncbi:MAG TPA: hypothetical protein RMH99_30680 [Sandaracinaceae bacterium LLY-WYZ-13_1]|nr:hypothetical protein [Sandaracinaceae bacterium LLY-WYZ-13_1]